MSVNDPCVSISTGTLSPDQRVNYTNGMVLGLDEFLQEQQYLLEKGYRHERALHGYGTVYGLHVSTAPAPGSDVTVSLAPGMAIDQWGREIVVRTAQCARLGAWLAAQEQQSPGSVIANAGVSGELTVYVVASYADCPDDLVPVPGQPCSSAAQSTFAARLRDSWDIELRWQPPPMPAWDTDRRLARLLSSVRIVPGLDPAKSSEAEIIDAVRALPSDIGAGPEDLWPLIGWPPGSPPPTPSGPAAVYRLSAETAADALDRIFTVWVTQVRPQLTPLLTQPSDSSDPAVLLASITFTLGPAGSPPGAAPAIASWDEPDDHGRPYVLHTRLLQELRLLGAEGTVTRGRQLATLTTSVDGQGRLVITVWFHLDQQVALTEPIQVASRSRVFGSFDPAAAPDPSGVSPPFSDVWILTAKNEFPAVDGDQIGLIFQPGSVLVDNAATTLADRIAEGLDLIDTMPGGEVVVYGTVAVPPPIVPPPPKPTAPVEFVTITPVPPPPAAVADATELTFEFWFHVQPRLQPPARVLDFGKGRVELIDEVTGLGVPNDTEAEAHPDVWRVTFPRFIDRAPSGYLRFVFPAMFIAVTVGGGPEINLLEWMNQSGVTFLNWDPAERTITAYCRLAGAQ